MYKGSVYIHNGHMGHMTKLRDYAVWIYKQIGCVKYNKIRLNTVLWAIERVVQALEFAF